MQHFKLLAAIAVAPQSMLSNCFAIPHTLKVRGDYVKIFAFQNIHTFKLCNLFFEKGYFNGVPIFPGQGEHFPLIQPGFVTLRLWTEQLQLIRMAFFRQC